MIDNTLDTTVFAHLTKLSQYTLVYRQILRNAELAMSFQTRPELAAAGYSAARQARLDELLETIVELPHSHQTNVWYTEGILRRARLKRARHLGGDASDGDLWIISSALEYGAPLVSHDRQQVALGRAMGLAVYTALPALAKGNPR